MKQGRPKPKKSILKKLPSMSGTSSSSSSSSSSTAYSASATSSASTSKSKVKAKKFRSDAYEEFLGSLESEGTDDPPSYMACLADKYGGPATHSSDTEPSTKYSSIARGDSTGTTATSAWGADHNERLDKSQVARKTTQAANRRAVIFCSLICIVAGVIVTVVLIFVVRGKSVTYPTPSAPDPAAYNITQIGHKDYRCQNIMWQYQADTPELCLAAIVIGTNPDCGLKYLTWNYVNHGCACYPPSQGCTLQYEGGRDTYSIYLLSSGFSVEKPQDQGGGAKSSGFSFEKSPDQDAVAVEGSDISKDHRTVEDAIPPSKRALFRSRMAGKYSSPTVRPMH